MIRKSRIKPKEAHDGPGIEANLGLDPKDDVAKIDRVLFESSPLPVAALAGPNHTALRQSCLLPTDRQDQR